MTKLDAAAMDRIIKAAGAEPSHREKLRESILRAETPAAAFVISRTGPGEPIPAEDGWERAASRIAADLVIEPRGRLLRCMSQKVAHRDGRRLDRQPSLSAHCGHGPIFIAQRCVANNHLQTVAGTAN